MIVFEGVGEGTNLELFSVQDGFTLTVTVFVVVTMMNWFAVGRGSVVVVVDLIVEVKWQVY